MVPSARGYAHTLRASPHVRRASRSERKAHEQPRDVEASASGFEHGGSGGGPAQSVSNDSHGGGGSPARLQGGACAPDEKMFNSVPTGWLESYSWLLQNISKVAIKYVREAQSGAMGPAGAAEPDDSDRYRVLQAKEREHQRKVEAKTKQAYHGHAWRADRPPPSPAAATRGVRPRA